MAIFNPLIHEFKETVADICFKFGLPSEWISPNLFFVDQQACA